jgi:hypothetical protein
MPQRPFGKSFCPFLPLFQGDQGREIVGILPPTPQNIPKRDPATCKIGYLEVGTFLDLASFSHKGFALGFLLLSRILSYNQNPRVFNEFVRNKPLAPISIQRTVLTSRYIPDEHFTS